jgi:adenylate cyclase
MSVIATAPPARDLKVAVVVVAVALICAILAQAAFDNVSLLTRSNQFLQDWEIASVFAPAAPQDPDIVIVTIDEATLQKFAYRSPVDRQYVSDLVRKLEARGPDAIGIDLLFDQPTEAAKDNDLRETLAHTSVPLIVSYIAASEIVSPEQKKFEDAMVPSKERALADLPTDQFDTARSVFPGSSVDGRYIPGFARALAGVVGIHTPVVQVPIIWHGHPLPTSTDPNPKPFRQISALLAGLMPDSWFRHKIVLIGSDVTLVDRHRTPYSSILAGDAGQLPGVVIQAHSVSQLIHAQRSPLAGWPTNFVLVFAFALMGALLGTSNAALLLRLTGAVMLIAILWIGGIAFFHFHNVMIGLLAPPISLVAAFATMDSLGGRAARRQREFIKGAFGRYVSPKLVERMVQDPSRMSLEGERRLMTYLFSDIQDFTAMTEKMDSKDLAPLLNAYLDGMTEIVMKHDGMVDKFIGDAVFAIFNAPIDLPDHAQRAVQCMLEMDRFTEDFRRKQRALGISMGSTRIGVHTGEAVIGNFGSQRRFTYTAQGDSVNTAARLEGINKYFGTRLCVSDATRLLCRDIAFRPIASALLKGKTNPLDLWEPLQDGAYRTDFLKAYQGAYDRLKMGESDAGDLLEALLVSVPDDPCVLFHARRLRQGLAGVKIVMIEK